MANWNKKALGIDISDHTIELAVLESAGGVMKEVFLGRHLIEPGAVEYGSIKDHAKLARSINGILTEAREHTDSRTKVVFGLPDSQVYLQRFEITGNHSDSPDRFVKKIALETIPLDERSAVLSYRITGGRNDIQRGPVRALLAATSRDTIAMWQDFFSGLGLKIDIFDIEPLGIYRGIYLSPQNQTVCLADLGAVTTNISIFDDAGLAYSYTLKFAGNDITEEIASVKKIGIDEAEKIKIAMGVRSNSTDNGEARKVAAGALDKIIEEIKINIGYFERKYETKIFELVLVGGTSLLPGLVEYVEAANFNRPVKLGMPYLASKTALEYIEAIGLATRGLDDRWERTDPVLGEKAVANPREPFFSFNRTLEGNMGLLMIGKKWRYIALALLAAVLLAAAAMTVINNEDRKLNGQDPPDSLKSAENQSGAEADTMPLKPGEGLSTTTEIKMIKIKQLSNNLNIRSGPGAGYGIISQALPLAEYETIEESGDWLKIKIDSGTGWIAGRFTDVISD